MSAVAMQALGVERTLLMRSFTVFKSAVGVLTLPGKSIWLPPTVNLPCLFGLSFEGSELSNNAEVGAGLAAWWQGGVRNEVHSVAWCLWACVEEPIGQGALSH